MKQLPTAAEVLHEVSAIDGLVYVSPAGAHAVLTAALKRWGEMLSLFAEILSDREEMARVVEACRKYYEDKMGNELPPKPPEAE